MSQVAQGSGIGGGGELTASEELFIQNLNGLSYVLGDILYYNGSNLNRLAIGTSGQILSVSSGIPSWIENTAGTRFSSSAELAALLSDETGSGLAVFSISPSLVTPILGVATATSINGLAITATTGTLTITNSKVLSVSNTLTFTGTDSSSVAFGTGGTVAYVANKLSVFAATTSAELAGVISDETGTDKLVFNTSPGFTTAINPLTNDSAALGTTSLKWSDLFLASGAVINFNAGDILLTHSADTLALTGGTLSVASTGVTNGISVTSTSTASFSAGISCNPVRTGTNTGWFAGLTFEAQANTDTSITMTDLWGGSGNARVNGASNVTRAVGFKGTVQHTSSGTSGSAIGFWAAGITKSAGAITNSYNFLGEDNSALGATGHWGVYMKGALMPNYFQGMVAIGRTAQPIATLDIQPNVKTSGALPYGIYMDGAAHTGITIGNASDVLLDFSRTMQFATGAIAELDTMRIKPRTYGAVGASTYTVASTLTLDGAPAEGTNVTITTPLTFWAKAGAVRFDGRMVNKQGADTASANDLTLLEDGNSWEITGTTQINAIMIARWQNGSQVTLLFTSTPTVKHNTAGGAGTVPILLADSLDFAATAGDNLTLLLSEIGGTQAWREISRTTI